MTFYFLENGEVMFIENFNTIEDAVEFRNNSVQFRKSTLAMRIN